MVKRVILTLVDGLRADAAASLVDGGWEWARREGSSTLEGRSVWPSITLPCHMSLFHSVPPERHNTLVNTWVPMARPVPGLLEVLAGAGIEGALFYTWEPLRDIGRPMSSSLSVYISGAKDPVRADLEIWRAFRNFPPHPFTFLYFGSVDEIGHREGWMSPAYLEAARRLDTLLAELLAGRTPEELIILVSDHGGEGRSHGTINPSDMTIPLAIVGPGFSAGGQLPPASLLDLAPTVLRAFGLKIPEVWEGRPLQEAR
jgi:hypothetical protein